MMKKILLLLLPVVLFLTSCSNDDDAASFSVSCTYLDIQEGSKFTYKYESVGTETTITSEVTSQETVDGVLLAVFESDGSSSGTSYLSCDGEKMISSAPAQTNASGGGVTTTGPIILTYDLGAPLNEENVVAEIESTTTYGGETFITTNRYYGMVVEKDLSMEVEGTNYTDVVRYELRTVTESSLLPGEEFELVKTVYYFAPDVATIYTEFVDPFTGTVTTKVSLTDYEY